MPTLQRHSVSLHYEDTGESATAGVPLVLLHGWCDDADSWRHNLPALSARHRCIVPEMRGHGRSGMPNDHAFFTEALAGDVVAICEAAGVVRPLVIGHSFGGVLAAMIADRSPGFARGVVVIDQPLEVASLGAQLAPMAEFIRNPASHLAFREGFKRSLMPEGTPSAVVEDVIASGLNTPVEVGLALWAQLFELTPAELTAKGDGMMTVLGTLPTLNIESRAIPEYHALLRQHAPDIRIEVIEGSHWLHMEHPGAFADLVEEFAASLPA